MEYKEVLRLSKENVKQNIDTPSRWINHISPMLEKGGKMVKKYGGDIEVVQLAILFHDFTRIKGDLKRHHITSALYAEKFLRKLQYDDNKITKIKRCIKNHRGSIRGERVSVEEKILSTADAIVHIEFPLVMFCACFAKKKYGINETKKWILSKIRRSLEKIYFIDELKDIKPKYDALILILSDKYGEMR